VASTIDVGNLVVRLVADAKQLEAGLKQGGVDLKTFESQSKQAMSSAQKATDSAAASINRFVGRIAGLAAAYVSVNAAVNAFNNEISNVSNLDHLSQAIGVSVQSLNELRGVALQLGIDFGVLQQSLSTFPARMTEALASPVSKGSQALRALGIDVRDASGNLRSMDELLPEFADKFSQYRDGLNKTALATAIFGEEAGPRLVPLLNQGRAGLEELRRAVTNTMTTEDVQRVRDYQKTIGQLQLAFEQFFRELTQAAGPVLTEVLQKLTRALQDMHVPTTFREELAGVDRQIADIEKEVGKLSDRFVDLEREKKSFFDPSQRLLDGLFGETPESVQKNIQDLTNQLDELIKRRNILQQRTIGEFETTVIPEKPNAPAMDPFALEKAQLALAQLQDRLLGTRDIFDEINFSWQKHAEVVTAAIEKINQANAQQFQRDAALAQFRRQQRLADQQGMMQVAESAASLITQLWPKQKGAAIAAAVINTAVGITRALATLPPPWSWAQAALIAASGAAQIATINSMNEKGGGTAAPTPTTDPNAGSDAPTQSRSLTISGIDPNAIFSGRQIEELIGNINSAVRDGVTLVSTRNMPI
jgi:TP901 family phage tail tape measure protein